MAADPFSPNATQRRDPSWLRRRTETTTPQFTADYLPSAPQQPARPPQSPRAAAARSQPLQRDQMLERGIHLNTGREESPVRPRSPIDVRRDADERQAAAGAAGINLYSGRETNAQRPEARRRSAGVFNGREVYIDPADQVAGGVSDSERLARRDDVAARRGGFIGGGPATAVIGMPEDEKMRRLQIALETTGRGSPSARKALIEGFYGDRQREADASMNSADNAARAAIQNARSADGFADRDLEAQGFNAEQAAARRKARAPMSAQEQAEVLKTLADVDATTSRTARENELHDFGAEGAKNEWSDKFIAAELERNGGDRAAAQRRLASYQEATGQSPAATLEGYAGYEDMNDDMIDAINQGSGVLDQFLYGDGVSFRDNQIDPATFNPDDVVVEDAGGLGGVARGVNRIFGTNIPTKKVSVPDDVYGQTATYMTEDDARQYSERVARRSEARRRTGG